MEGLLLMSVSAWRARGRLVVVHVVMMKMAVHVAFWLLSRSQYVWYT